MDCTRDADEPEFRLPAAYSQGYAYVSVVQKTEPGAEAPVIPEPEPEPAVPAPDTSLEADPKADTEPARPLAALVLALVTCSLGGRIFASVFPTA